MQNELTLWAKKIIIAIAIFSACYLLYISRNILFIILLSGFLTVLMNPLIKFGERYRVAPAMTLTLVYICIILIGSIVVATIIPIVVEYITQSISVITNWANTAKTIYDSEGIAGFHFHPYMERVISWIFPSNSDFDHILEIIKQNAGSIQAFFTNQVSNITSGGVSVVSSVGGTVANWVLVAVTTFLMVLERDRIGGFLLGMMPDEWKEYAKKHYFDVETVLTSWTKAMLLLSLSIFIVTYIGLIIVQSVFGFSLGRTFTLALISGIMEFIPYVGPLVALIPAAIIALGISWKAAIVIVVLYVIIQRIENDFLVPYVMSRSLDLSPFFVFVTVLFGATLGGIIGIIVAVPIAAVLATLLRKHDMPSHKKERKKLTIPEKFIFWKRSTKNND